LTLTHLLVCDCGSRALAKYLKAIMAEEGMFEGDWLIPVMRKIAREARLLGQKVGLCATCRLCVLVLSQLLI
jgi:hypothetical protein